MNCCEESCSVVIIYREIGPNNRPSPLVSFVFIKLPIHKAGKICHIARNFRGLKFSRMSLTQTFRDLIFEDCVRARRRMRNMWFKGKILEDKIFEVRH